MGYLVAAYAIVGLALSGYALGLIRRERALRREISASGRRTG